MNRFVKRIGRFSAAALARLQSGFDRAYLADDVPGNAKQAWSTFLSQMEGKSGLRVLEIGSREVTGPSTMRKRFLNSEYVGFDYYPGKNVDVVGDVHRLSSYFAPGEKFDIIYTSACFEHFAMPWLVAIEIAKMLKVGGILFVATHFSFVTHERPWNFFQFSDMGLRVLFPSALGFECIEASMSEPIVGRFSALAHESLRYQPIRGLYCSSEYFGRKVREVESFVWNEVSVEEVVSGTTYPAPKKQ
jgi:SAM-dependent methyltransferase